MTSKDSAWPTLLRNATATECFEIFKDQVCFQCRRIFSSKLADFIRSGYVEELYSITVNYNQLIESLNQIY